jgi:hypothetical protein
MTTAHVRILFAIAAIYDFVIGLTFLVRGPQLFDWASVPQPNHWGYIQFGSLMLVIFGLMFAAVAWRPFDNRNLICYGVLLKLCYVGLVGYYWFQTGVPMLFKPFLFIDLVMLVLFVMSLGALRRPAASTA